MYFVECSIHLIEEYWLQLHISSGFRSNHLLLRQCCFVWSEIIRPHSSGNVRFSESMPVRLFGYLYSKNSDLNCESLAYNSSNTPLTFDSKGRSSISIIPHIILSVILILLNFDEHIGIRAIFCQGGGQNNLPKKFSHVAQIFTKQSERTEGHTMQQHRPTCEVKIFLHMNLSYELIKHVNSCLCHFDGRTYQWYDPCHCWSMSLLFAYAFSMLISAKLLARCCPMVLRR